MFSIFSNKSSHDKEQVLIVSIQSDLVEGFLVSMGDMKVINSVSHSMKHSSHISAEHITKRMLKEVHKVVQETIQGRGYIKSVQYILSSPWVLSQSKTVKIKYDKDTEISDSYVGDIIDEERDKFIRKTKNGSSTLIPIEQKIFDVKLNGYSVHNYRGKKAKTLEISFAFTLSPEEIIEKIRSAISDKVHIRHESYHSSLLLQYIALRSISKEDEEYILIHIHGELTDIVIVKRGFSSYLASFPFGVSTLIKKMSASFHNNPETMASNLSMYIGGKHEDTHKKRIENVLHHVLNGWLSRCHHAFSGLGEGVVLPNKVYIHSLNYSQIFKKVLKEEFEVSDMSKSIREMYMIALKDML